MKKFSLVIMSALLMSGAAWAVDGFSVIPPTIPQGGSAEVEIVFESATAIYKLFQLDVEMPEGITCVKVNDKPKCAPGPLIASTDHEIASNQITGRERFLDHSPTNTVIPAGSGVIMTVTYQADGSLEVGSTHKGYIRNITWGDIDNNPYEMDDIEFTVTIGENRIVLNENSTTPPEDADGVNVRVIRSIKAGDWSTICLPFAMSEAQCKAAFGDYVELANFTSWSSEEDDDGNIISLAIGFTDVTSMEANHPYIIKVSEDVSEFNVDGVDIEVEEEPYVLVGTKKVEKGFFTGTYVANTTVPLNNLFLSGNHFWYSVGTTQMKAFRGYFELYDVLTNPGEAGARIALDIDETPTRIITVNKSQKDSNVYYDLMGRRAEKPRKGNIYIVNGKKVYFK